jgi:hypothetical protein
MTHIYDGDPSSKDKVCDEIEAFYYHLGEEEYPSVWVGEPGVSALDLLKHQQSDLFGDPSSPVEERKLAIPRLNGLDVVQRFNLLLEVDDSEDLYYEVMCIFSARQHHAILPVRFEDLSGGWSHVPLDRVALLDMPSEFFDELRLVVEHVKIIREYHKHAPYVIEDCEPVRLYLEEHEFYG